MNETLQLVRKYNVKLSRRAGQQQVVDHDVLDRMVSYGRLDKSDTVLEIGAGLGNLTALLAVHAGKVIAIERDERLIRILTKRLVNHQNVEILHGDATRIELPKFNKVVANLPYSISSDITFKLLGHKFELAVLMYQREFAERLTAKPGSDRYGRLTVNTYYRAGVELLDEVSPSAFFPEPKVASAIVRLVPRKPPFEVKDERVFADVVRALFQHRRQRARNALCRSFHEVFHDVKIPKADRRSVIDQKIPKRLAETRTMDLTPKQIGEIADLLTCP